MIVTYLHNLWLKHRGTTSSYDCMRARQIYCTHKEWWHSNTHTCCVNGVCLFDRFQSERESGDRNFAIGYYLKEKKVWLTECYFHMSCAFILISTIFRQSRFLFESVNYPCCCSAVFPRRNRHDVCAGLVFSSKCIMVTLISFKFEVSSSFFMVS